MMDIVLCSLFSYNIIYVCYNYMHTYVQALWGYLQCMVPIM